MKIINVARKYLYIKCESDFFNINDVRDKMSNQNNTPKEFVEYLHTLIEGIVVNEYKFDKYKKWLKKYCNEYNIDFKYIEEETIDFLALFEDEQTDENTNLKKMLYKTGKNIFLTSDQIESFYIKKKTVSKSQMQHKKQLEKILKVELPQKVNKFINKHKGEWNNIDWLNFRDSILNYYNGYVDEIKLSEIIDEKRQNFLLKQMNINNQQKEIDYKKVKVKNNILAYQEFILKYKEGQLVDQARQNIEKLSKELGEIKQKDRQTGKFKNNNLSVEIIPTKTDRIIWQDDIFGYFTDERDGNKYRAVKIGQQIWITENLVFKPSTGNYWIYDNKNNNTKYGYLYDWITAKDICPNGWRLPLKRDFEILINHYGGDVYKAYLPFIEEDNNISVLFAGCRGVTGKYYNQGSNADLWSASEKNNNNAYHLNINSNDKKIYISNYDKRYGCSVRCLLNM